MRRKTSFVRGVSALAFATALLLPAAGGLRAADDTALFSNQVAPNVVVVVDNSISMNQMVWHPAFNPDLFYDGVCSTDPNDAAYDQNCLAYDLCPISNGDAEFTAGAGESWSTFGAGSLRTLDGTGTITKSDNDSDCRDRWIPHDPLVEADSNQSQWDIRYLRWYFSRNVELDHDGDTRTILTEILDNNDGVRSQCVLTQDGSLGTNFPIYRRARVTAAQDILREVMCNTAQVANIRYGLAQFEDASDPDGGYISVPVGNYNAGQATALFNAISSVSGETSTPLGETLYNVYRYFMSRTATETALGVNTTTRFPVYNLDTSGNTGGTVPISPVTDDCQLHFVIVLTDGEPTRDDFDNMNLTRFQTELIGNYNTFAGDETEVSGSNEAAWYLDDIAKFMQEKDFAPGATYPSLQTIDVYTVGFSTTPLANDLLKRTGEQGGGEFFFSNDPQALTTALTNTINAIVAKSKSFTAATVPASRATDGNNFFTSYFTPAKDDPYWIGHLKLYDFSADGEVLDAPPPIGSGACALQDPQAPTRCRIGGLDLTLSGFWDAGEEIPDAGLRNLYVSRYQTMAPTAFPATQMDEFDWQGAGKMTPTDLGLLAATAGDIASYDQGVNGFDMTAISTDVELTDAVVRYIRGCNFNNGPTCTDRGDFEKLWDIFHSNPVVVGPPNAGLREPSYRAFVLKYKHRKRLIYAGSNGGFMHGFDAGDFDGNLTPPGYTRGTGEEQFGFMAYPARQNIAGLPRDLWPRGDGAWNGYTMDGSATAADVWFAENPDDDPEDLDLTLQNWEYWRTVLIGGMREGGRAVWALDVTDPGDAVLGAPTVFPGYLWEFPCEETACDGWRPYMGETWSQPVVTRVKATIDCGDASDWTGCAQVDRWVAIFGAGYDDSGDPNLPHDADANVTAGEYDPSVASTTKLAGRALFMVDIATGELLGAKRFQHDGTAGDPSDGEPGMAFALASTPSVFDVNFDGYGDVVVIGDLGGNVWKWVINDPAEDHVNGTSGDDQQARWPFVQLLSTESYAGPPPHYKSFFFPPTGAMVGPKLMLAIGSGERKDLDFGQDGLTDVTERNRFYVFKDIDPLEIERDPAVALPYTDVLDEDLIDGTTIATYNPHSCIASDKVGFYFEGADGEKFITDSVIFFGVVFTTSYIPAPSTANACTASGDAYLYGFDLLCGEGRFTAASGDPNDPKRRKIGIGEGLPNAPRVSVGPTDKDPNDPDPDPCKDMVIVITSENGGFSDGRCERQNTGLALESWRDR